MEDHTSTTVSKKALKTLLVVAIAAMALAPVAASAVLQFIDVPQTDIFYEDIIWAAENDITKGCNPPTNDMFCPEDNVTREQMAAFMRRLSTGNVVNARTAETADRATVADLATEATDADTVDGLHAADLAPSFLTARDNSGNLDLSPQPVICATTDFTPTRTMSALILTETTIQAPDAGPIDWGTKAAYSTDGGVTWINADPDWWLRSTSPTSDHTALTSNGVVELAAGTTYRFGQRVRLWLGQSTTDEFMCKTIVQIVPRTATTGVQAAPLVAPTGSQLP